MCPLDITMGKAMQYYETFLPTYMAYKDPDNTYKVSKSTKKSDQGLYYEYPSPENWPLLPNFTLTT